MEPRCERRRGHGVPWVALLVMAVVGTLTVRVSAAATPVIDKRIIPLRPGTTIVRVEFLTGEFDDLRVTEHVERATGKRVGVPVLRGTLTLKNESPDRAAHLLAGKIVYLDEDGRPIAVPLEQGHTTFKFFGPTADRLDPNEQVSVSIAVPYPVSALTPERIREVGLELTYTSIPYRQTIVRFPVVVGE